MSDTFEHAGWSEGTSAWAVPEMGAPVPPAVPGGPGSGPTGRDPGGHSPGAAVLVLVGALVAFVLALGFGAVQSRLTSPASTSTDAAGRAFTDLPATGRDSSAPSSANRVVDKVDDGIVNITTTLGYQHAAAAGTGVILTSTGQVLTNNHVIEGSTRITATLATTGKTYVASVVGTSPVDDIAVLQLQGAANLKPVPLSSTPAKIGDSVVAMGNAGGEGGLPAVATGQVIALDQAITATDEGGGNPRRLTNLIQVSAPIESGDSGGPLANASGEVVGIDTAASVGGGRLRSTTTSGYAIPIAKALSIVKQIQSGNPTEQIHIGLPGFLGVQLTPGSTAAGGAGVAGVESGKPAAGAGIAAGDTIVSLNGATVGSSSALSGALRGLRPGAKVSVGWTTSSGAARSATVTLAAGPAD